jgi:hypothetical protein
MLNLFQHLNFGPEAVLEGTVNGLGLGLWGCRQDSFRMKLLGLRPEIERRPKPFEFSFEPSRKRRRFNRSQ